MRAALVRFSLQRSRISFSVLTRAPRRPHGARVARLLVILLLIGAGGGRLAGAPAPPPAQMHIMVEADRVRIGEAEWVPRFLDLPAVLAVGAGQSITLSTPATYDYIEVGGRLTVAATTVKFTHLIVLPGGSLDVKDGSTLVIRDVPIDTRRDPFQWGNGLVNFGMQTREGAYKTPFVELSADAEAGTTSLSLASAPIGWKVGDELLKPDTRQFTPSTAPRHESPVTIAAISGTSIGLSKPLDFEHASIRDPDGALVLRPRVANLTRGIVLKSENPSGVRGHTANVGHDASWVVRGNQFVGLGRTQAVTLDNTAPDLSHIGTNQIGRYSDHEHHAGTSRNRRETVANAYLGTFGSKWAHVVHVTHDTLVEDNVCTDYQGGCFATEDGPEVRNVFRRNFAAYATTNNRSAHKNIPDCTGCEGSLFWFRGIAQTVEGNEAWNGGTGFNYFHRGFVGVATLVPSVPGGAADVPFDPATTVPVRVRGNVSGANHIGPEFWNTPRFPLDDEIAAFNSSKQVYNAPGGRVWLRNARLIGANWRSICLSSSSAYSRAVEVDGGEIRGCKEGATDGVAMDRVRLANLIMQNEINIDVTERVEAEYTFENLMHLPAGTKPNRFIVLQKNEAVIWKPGEPFPGGGRAEIDWAKQRGSAYAVINWQGTGRDYRLLYPQQNRENAAWPASAARPFQVPEDRLTMGQAWDKFGMAFRGDVYQAGSVVSLDGLVGGVARLGLDTPLGLPRAVVTYPNMLAPAVVSGTKIDLNITLTGQVLSGSLASEVVAVSVDGGSPILSKTGSRGLPGRRFVKSLAVDPGRHEVKTWREDTAGNLVRGSELTFSFFVEEGGPPPSWAALSRPGSVTAAAWASGAGASPIQPPGR